MSSRQEDILDAAIHVLGGEGARHLTHRAVDAAANVPAGSTSNYFRTRDALMRAIVTRFAVRERQAWESIAAAPQPNTAEDLAVALAAFVREATGPGRVLTLARYAIFVEAALRPDLRSLLARTGEDIRIWGAQWLAAIGSADPRRDTQLVLDQLDGLMLHELAFPDPGFDPLPRLRALIAGLAAQ